MNQPRPSRCDLFTPSNPLDEHHSDPPDPRGSTLQFVGMGGGAWVCAGCRLAMGVPSEEALKVVRERKEEKRRTA